MADLPPPEDALAHHAPAWWLQEGQRQASEDERWLDTGAQAAVARNTDPDYGGDLNGLAQGELGAELRAEGGGERISAWSHLRALGDAHTAAGLAAEGSLSAGLVHESGPWTMAVSGGGQADAWRVAHPLPADLGLACAGLRGDGSWTGERLRLGLRGSAWRGGVYSQDIGAWAMGLGPAPSPGWACASSRASRVARAWSGIRWATSRSVPWRSRLGR